MWYLACAYSVPADYHTFPSTKQLNHVDSREANLDLTSISFQYITTLKARNCDILDISRSIQYLPLNKLQFLRVHNFIQMIESTFVSIEHSVFLFNEQLVW